MNNAFHLAFNVTNLDQARRFYGGVLGCTEGRSTDTWVDFDFFGHQLSMHLGEPFKTDNTGRLEAAQIDFVLPPQVRFEGEPGEQWTMFFRDFCGNPIEIKGFPSLSTLYAT